MSFKFDPLVCRWSLSFKISFYDRWTPSVSFRNPEPKQTCSYNLRFSCFDSTHGSQYDLFRHAVRLRDCLLLPHLFVTAYDLERDMEEDEGGGGEISPAVRLVRCPKCGKLLSEVTGFKIYRCGGCNATLQGIPISNWVFVLWNN